MAAVDEYQFTKFAIAGGVASNSALRAAFQEACHQNAALHSFALTSSKNYCCCFDIFHTDFLSLYLNSCEMKGIAVNTADVAASFQKAVTDVLVEHAMAAVDEYQLFHIFQESPVCKTLLRPFLLPRLPR